MSCLKTNCSIRQQNIYIFFFFFVDLLFSFSEFNIDFFCKFSIRLLLFFFFVSMELLLSKQFNKKKKKKKRTTTTT